MTTEAQTCAIGTCALMLLCLRAYKASLHLSRVLYKSTLFMQNKPNLRKVKMNLNFYPTKDYEKTGLSDKGKTNPIQTQYKAKTNPIPEMSKMNVTSILTKDYENERLR